MPDISVAVIVLVTEDPWVTVLAPPLERERFNDEVGAFTVSEKLVFLDTPPP